METRTFRAASIDEAYEMVRAALGRRPGKRAIAIRGYAPTPASRSGLQTIVYGDRRHPSYAWSFDRGDGLANVGYGEFVVARDDAAQYRALALSKATGWDRIALNPFPVGD